MKQFILLLICIFGAIATIHAQNEISNDSLQTRPSLDEQTMEELMPETRSFGNFLIDMTLLNLQAPPQLSDFKLELPDASKDYNQLFRLNPDMTFSQGTYNSWTLGTSIGWSPFWSTGLPATLQSSSFKLKNGMRITTYGEYTKEGRKVYNPSALPWERNNFKGAFELKSANGAFGFRMEVQQGY